MSRPEPPEPTGPSATGGRLRRGWIAGWSTIAAVASVALVAAWMNRSGLELLGALSATVAFSATAILHHVVVTQDAGELTAPRPRSAPLAESLSGARRRFLGGLLAAVGLAAAALFGLVRYGPRPIRATAWSRGVRLTTIEGSPLRPSDIPLGGVVTVWPEHSVGTELAATMLIRLREPPQPPTRLADVVDETLVAYSRLCTHAGCAVALYRDHDQALFCPCHQATFDARRGAVPTSGPASHPLPQLPLTIDDEGYLAAAGELDSPPGPVGGSVLA